MKEIFACLVGSIVSWVCFFYERRRLAKRKSDWVDKLWYDSLDLRVLMLAIALSIFAVYLIVDYFMG